MTNNEIKELECDDVGKAILEFIPNVLGINLCAIETTKVIRKDNGELKEIYIRTKNE